MQINAMNVSQQTVFTGTVDRAVVKRIKMIEQQTLDQYLKTANRNGQKVDLRVVTMIKARFAQALKTLKEKAELLFDDSVITLRKDMPQFYVENKKMPNQFSRILDRENYNAVFDNKYFKFKKDFAEACKKDGLEEVCGLNDDKYIRGFKEEKSKKRLENSMPENLCELEGLVEIFNPKYMNRYMLDGEKAAYLGKVNFKKVSKLTSRLKNHVREIYAKEKELEPSLRVTGYWQSVKNAVAKNADQAKLEKENAKIVKYL